MRHLIVAADVGGSSTRAAVADLDGIVLGYADTAGGNPHAVGPELSAQRIREATERCLQDVPGDVQAFVVGLAGGSAVSSRPEFRSAITPDRMPVAPRLVSDLTAAFAAGTPGSDGYVIIAGTGAVAGRIVGHEVVESRDGWGWLLGDEGAGFWLGREVVRSTLAALQSSLPLDPLHHAVLSATGTEDADGLVRRCYASPPIELARLAPLVAAHAGDGAGRAIAEGAVDRLEALLDGLDVIADQPVVLAGSVLSPDGPVGAGLRARLTARWPNQVLGTSSGVVGALWIAARSLGTTTAEVHRTMIDSLRDLLRTRGRATGDRGSSVA